MYKNVSVQSKEKDYNISFVENIADSEGKVCVKFSSIYALYLWLHVYVYILFDCNDLLINL